MVKTIKILFYRSVVKPIMFVFLYNSRRSRVVIRAGNEYLLLLPRLGPEKWILAGGGIHKKETDEEAAIREVREETGIPVRYEHLQKIWEGEIQDGKMVLTVHLFLVDLKQKPELKLARWEIAKAQWATESDLRQIPIANIEKQLLAYVARTSDRVV